MGSKWWWLNSEDNRSLFLMLLPVLLKTKKAATTHTNGPEWEAWLTKSLNMNFDEATLLVHIISLSTGTIVFLNGMLYNDEYKHMSNQTNKVCRRLRQYQKNQKDIDIDSSEMNAGSINSPEIEAGMQELVQLVIKRPSERVPETVKQTFLIVAKTFYYAANCSVETRNIYISKIFFEPIV
ncbi:copalyl diphosphate synthase 2, chloroplastic-like [Coffea arabica]|uniref:Copalyl diphosphate synthase 2, chloroplastic-like n=1 Tax=Coffea arabica TaxID=13443 RepID=A0ABM4VC91_COFAR